MSINRRTVIATVMSAAMLAASPALMSAALAATPVQVRGVGAVDVETIDVRVVSVDLATRNVVVEKAGHQWRVTVPEEAGSLAALRPRDNLQINRVESAMVSVLPAKSGAKPDITYDTTTDNGLFGGLPARWIITNVNATAKFKSFDAAKGVVNYTGPEGDRSVRVVDPAAIAALQNLKKGDLVTFSFTRATEIVLTPRKF